MTTTRAIAVAGRRPRLGTGARIQLLGLVALALGLVPALPLAAAVDPLQPDVAKPAPTTSTKPPAEDRETISSLATSLQSETEVVEEADAVARPPNPGIVFPLASGGTYTASFGAPRDRGLRQHMGIDIFADKLTPVVAAADGIVTLVRDSVGDDCCVVRLRHGDGSETLYLHLNNDSPGTDDGLGYGIAEGIEIGVTVEAGQVIGFVGDSGNAEETPPHLHFEYHDPSGTALDPFPILRAAQGFDQTAPSYQHIPTELAFTGISTLVFGTAGFALVIVGILLISFTACDDLWEPSTARASRRATTGTAT